MATTMEIRIVQKTMLFELLMLKKEMAYDNARLNEMISKLMAAMEKEDVSYVRENVKD